ncbi:unnamed protein product [Sphagnum jensenii]|uniref:Mediator of RNA polymerase II transcription subunit 6 n=1 Tax=Sphagnum jensenii TaxID=128206 RepID=A0ABP1AVG2_9BRYO
MATMGQQLLVPAETGPPGTEMTSISFRDQLWLSAYPLDRNLVFDYFALSPFYDRSCSNERLRMELIHPLDMAHLSKRTGIEYILQEAQEPNLFVIRKQKREGPEKVTALAAYYVLDGSIYQAPQLYTVIGSRVVRSLYHISNAFLQVATKLEKIGYEVSNGKTGGKAAVQSVVKKPTDKVVDVNEARRIDSILAGVLRKLPPAPAPPALPIVAPSVVPGMEASQAPVTTASKDGGVEQALPGGNKQSTTVEPNAKRPKIERL